ncbi:hypothetical protein D3C80_1906940 [compost metagenome]
MLSHLHAEYAAVNPVFDRQNRTVPGNLDKDEIAHTLPGTDRTVNIPERVMPLDRITGNFSHGSFHPCSTIVSKSVMS